MKRWTSDQIPDLSDKTAIVTGANSGIGIETARALASKGATVLMACRDITRGEGAAMSIRSYLPEAKLQVLKLDLASLDSIAHCAAAIREEHDQLHMVINNAGVMIPPFGRTQDDFELQFGVNHLGHFALNAQIIDRIVKTPDSRVVTVSSLTNQSGKLDLNDPNYTQRKYNAFAAYAQSKLANILYTQELQRRLEAAGHSTISVASHPGWTASNLHKRSKFIMMANPLLAQKASQGALPSLFAASDPNVKGGGYYGPGGFMHLVGRPAAQSIPKAASNEALGQKLWALSEELTKQKFEI